MSLCRIRVSVVLTNFAPFGPKLTVAIRSEDSHTSFTQYSGPELSFASAIQAAATSPAASPLIQIVRLCTGAPLARLRRILPHPAAQFGSRRIYRALAHSFLCKSRPSGSKNIWGSTSFPPGTCCRPPTLNRRPLRNCFLLSRARMTRFLSIGADTRNLQGRRGCAKSLQPFTRRFTRIISLWLLPRRKRFFFSTTLFWVLATMLLSRHLATKAR